MKKCIIIICVMGMLLVGCNDKVTNTDKINTSGVETEGKIITKGESELTSVYDDENRLIQDTDFAYVYDVTKDLGENIGCIMQYQYFIFNKDKTKVIDHGFMEKDIYYFDKISDGIIRGKLSRGSNAWESVYYNQNTGQKSHTFENVLIEFERYVAYPQYSDKKTYLIIENMFKKKNNTVKVIIGNDYYIPGMLTASYKDGIIYVKYEDANEQFTKEVNVSKLTD